MNTTVAKLTLVVGVLAVSACKRKLPTACFTVDRNTIETGQSVTFTSCSSNAARLEWNFGDGTTATGESVTHKYEKAGTYVVQARAFSKKDKSSDRFSAIIVVNDPPPPPPAKKRYLTKLELTAFPQTKPDASNWDGFPSTGSAVNPDVCVKMELVSGGWSNQTPEVTNATQANLPLKWDFSPVSIELTNQNWRVSVLDNDVVAGVGGADTLFTTIINPSTAAAPSGKISLSGNNVSLHILFDER